MTEIARQTEHKWEYRGLITRDEHGLDRSLIPAHEVGQVGTLNGVVAFVTREDYAQYIVTAVNSHADLLAALERIAGLGTETPAMGRVAKAQGIAFAAIAKAR